MKLSFFIPGRPRGKQRHGINRLTGRGYTPKETKEYEKLIGQLALEARNNKAKIYAPTDKMVNLLVIIYYSNWHWLPDCSNVLKSVEDGMNGIIYHDDKQVAGSIVDRLIVPDEFSGVGVMIEEAKENAYPQEMFK